MHKFFAKIKADKNELQIIKMIRSFNQGPISDIKQKLENFEVILETPYLDLEKLKKFSRILSTITELGGEIHLFLDSEDDQVTLAFLGNIIAAQEDTKRYIEEEDLTYDEDE